MKILHVVLNYYPSIGGTQVFYKNISENCIKLYNDEVEVFTVDSYYGSHSNQYKEIFPKQETINGVNIKRYSFYRKHKYWFSLLNKIMIKIFGKSSPLLNRYITGPWSSSLMKAMYQTDADVISASSLGFYYMHYPLFRHKLKKPKPFVFQGAIHFPYNKKDHGISAKMLEAIKASDYYLCNTEYEKNRLMQLGVDEEMLVITGTAVDVEKFSKGNGADMRNHLQLNDDDILISYIGRLEATKSIIVLIDAFVQAYQKNNQLKLVIAGFTTDYVKKIKAHISNLSEVYQQNIFIVLNLKETEKISLYHATDILVLPSVNESFGMVFLEAWSCKKPVIGTNIGAIKSVIDEGKNGLLMQPENANDLADKILLLANNKELRMAMGLDGYNKTCNNFTWEIVTERFRNTYIKAIQKFNTKYSKSVN